MSLARFTRVLPLLLAAIAILSSDLYAQGRIRTGRLDITLPSNGRFVYRTLFPPRTIRYSDPNVAINGQNVFGSTVTTLGQQIIPLLPQLVGAATLPNGDGAANLDEEAAGIAPSDAILDRLADSNIHSQRMTHLEGIEERSLTVLTKLKVATPKPFVQKKPIEDKKVTKSEGQPKKLRLKVLKSSAVDITPPEVRSLLARASSLLQKSDGSDDVEVNIEFALDESFLDSSGQIRNYSDSFGANISAQPVLDQLRSAYPAADVIIVKDLKICGNRPGTGIVGCAAIGDLGVQIVVERPLGFSESQLGVFEPIIWAHELGHNGGSSHRNVSNALMHRIVGRTNHRVNQREATGFLNLDPAGSRVHGSHAHGSATIEFPSEYGEMIAREVFLAVYPEGIPWTQWHEYWDSKTDGEVSDAVLGLKLILEEEDSVYEDTGARFVQVQPSAIAMLCAIATDESLKVVLDYATKLASRDDLGMKSDDEFRIDGLASAYLYMGAATKLRDDTTIEVKQGDEVAVIDLCDTIAAQIEQNSALSTDVAMKVYEDDKSKGVTEDAAMIDAVDVKSSLEGVYAFGMYGLQNGKASLLEKFMIESEEDAAELGATIGETADENKIARLSAVELRKAVFQDISKTVLD